MLCHTHTLLHSPIITNYCYTHIYALPHTHTHTPTLTNNHQLLLHTYLCFATHTHPPPTLTNNHQYSQRWPTKLTAYLACRGLHYTLARPALWRCIDQQAWRLIAAVQHWVLRYISDRGMRVGRVWGWGSVRVVGGTGECEGRESVRVGGVWG